MSSCLQLSISENAIAIDRTCGNSELHCPTPGMRDKCYLSSRSVLTPAPPALIPGLVLGHGTHYPLPSCLPAV